MSGSWAFCAKLWLTDKLGGRWSGHGLVWGRLRGKWSGLRSASWKMVWTGGLLRGKRSGLEVCLEETAWSGGMLGGKWPGLDICCEENGLFNRSAGFKWSGLSVGWKLYVKETKYKWMNMETLSQATKSNRRDAGKYHDKNYSLALQHTI